MTWPAFVPLFVGLTLAALLGARRRFAGHWIHMAQVTVFVTCMTFLIDYPAEQRHFWRFSKTSGFALLDTPFENHVFVAACAIDIMIVFLSLQHYLHGNSHAGESPGQRRGE
jgi:uncharacterized membrane protein